MEVGSNVIIDREVMIDSNLTNNKGVVLKLWNEPLKNSQPTPLAKILLDDGTIEIVGQHEVKIHHKLSKEEFIDGAGNTVFHLVVMYGGTTTLGENVEREIREWINTYYV